MGKAERDELQRKIEAVAAELEPIGIFAIMMTEEGEILFACALDTEEQRSHRAAPFRGLIAINQASVKAITAALMVAQSEIAATKDEPETGAISFGDGEGT